MNRLPVIPTLLVALAVATMIGLGIWQLQRKEQKDALLSRYESAVGLPAVVWPTVPDPAALPLFRRSSLLCARVLKIETVSGSNSAGKAGFAHIASCRTGEVEGPDAKVAFGWSERPQSPRWSGGPVEGIIAPDGTQDIKLVSKDAVEGLEILAEPSPRQIPNNHLLYAIQWFIFAAAATIIYLLALRKRIKAS
ncbi:SURF1 family cytochrome oxidase biogenesis protein [Sphingorhabdus sp.]|jgi:surfeit locus 1 family protein|uniref:SURF1 family cytochrome oxidase biogenesis protein n=1 Tax=Sphingorhabdus sp. TaxID=1902408 RepID=UPI0037C728BE